MEDDSPNSSHDCPTKWYDLVHLLMSSFPHCLQGSLRVDSLKGVLGCSFAAASAEYAFSSSEKQRDAQHMLEVGGSQRESEVL